VWHGQLSFRLTTRDETPNRQGQFGQSIRSICAGLLRGITLQPADALPDRTGEGAGRMNESPGTAARVRVIPDHYAIERTGIDSMSPERLRWRRRWESPLRCEPCRIAGQINGKNDRRPARHADVGVPADCPAQPIGTVRPYPSDGHIDDRQSRHARRSARSSLGPARRPERQNVQHREPDQQGRDPRPEGLLAVVAHGGSLPRDR